MKIAFVVQDMVGQGVQYATAIIARAFVKKGWQVDLLVSPVMAQFICNTSFDMAHLFH